MVMMITTFATILRLLFGCCMIPMIQLGHPIFGFAVLEFFFLPRPQPIMAVVFVFPLTYKCFNGLWLASQCVRVPRLGSKELGHWRRRFKKHIDCTTIYIFYIVGAKSLSVSLADVHTCGLTLLYLSLVT